jgi:predicted nucleic acid-binding protein
VLVYAYDPSDAKKQRVAQALIRRALVGEFVVSSQVLAEFASTLLHKMSPAARARDVIAALDALGPILVIAPDGDTVRRAVEARAEYDVHFYDGMIIAAAERGGCSRILSEDLNADQKYFGILAENPFR